MNYADRILPLVTEYNYMAYAIGFFAAFIETLFGIGMFIPGSTVVVVLAALSSKGYFHIGFLIPAVLLGGGLGDFANYVLGHRIGMKIVGKNFFFWNEKIFQSGKEFFEKYGGKSVFIARFVPSLRENIPFISGIFQMQMRVFIFWDILGVTIWGIGWCLIGYYLGNYLNITKKLMFIFGVGIFIFTGICVYLKIRKEKKRKAKEAENKK